MNSETASGGAALSRELIMLGMSPDHASDATFPKQQTSAGHPHPGSAPRSALQFTALCVLIFSVGLPRAAELLRAGRPRAQSDLG